MGVSVPFAKDRSSRLYCFPDGTFHIYIHTTDQTAAQAAWEAVKQIKKSGQRVEFGYVVVRVRKWLWFYESVRFVYEHGLLQRSRFQRHIYQPER